MIQQESPSLVLIEPDARQRTRLKAILSRREHPHFWFPHDWREFQDGLPQQGGLPGIQVLIVSSAGLPPADNELALFLANADEDAPPVLVLDNGEKSAAPLSANWVAVTRQAGDEELLATLVEQLQRLRAERTRRLVHEERLVRELAERRVMEARLKFLVANDELTGMSNRHTLEKELRLAMRRCRNRGQDGALFYLDMDRFSLINDLEGHEAGDLLLTELVQIWRGALRGDYLAARMSADEFCLFVENLPSHAATRLAEDLRKAVDERRFLVGRENYHLSVSIGVALLNSEQSDEHPSDFIARARQSCATAKSAGGNMAHLYNPDDKVVRERQSDLRWVPVIREALKDDRFYLMFQPIVSLSDLSVSHYEVLVRMRNAKGEDIQPGQFIPAAERMGLIHKIDFCVVEQAIEFLASLPSSQKRVEVAVNLSTSAFMNSELLSLVREKLELTWVDASRLMFEITETSAVTNYRQTRGMISSLRGLGCRFALDDFGSGFCSFEYLKNFPVDCVKIDGQFVRNLSHDETDQVLVRSMTDIAHKLGKRVVAEYVDSADTLSLLRQFGVDYGQGYYFGPPARHLLDQPLALDIQPFSANRPFLTV